MLKVAIMKKILLIILLFGVILSSCQESELKDEAYLIERSELETQAGFDWFRYNYDEYEVNQLAIDNIKSEFNNSYKFLVFVKPTCNCKGTQIDFPSLIKTFELAGIPVDNYEIWATAKEDYKHPYTDKISLNDLPSCYILKDGIPVYSVLDTFNLRPNIDSIVKVEDIISEALSK